MFSFITSETKKTDMLSHSGGGRSIPDRTKNLEMNHAIILKRVNQLSADRADSVANAQIAYYVLVYAMGGALSEFCESNI